MFSLRRMTILTLIILPMFTLGLMMTGIALTQAAMLQKVKGGQVQASQVRQSTAATHFYHVPADKAVTNDAPGQLAQELPTAMAMVVKPGYGSVIDRALVVAGLLPLILIGLLNWLLRRKGYGNGVGEGSIGSSSASSR
ncbi:MAG: hypothetical protein KC900_01270 [Candidatus Omnitrophica bacterium]|nr:hypothetical protein [Candidatus Omnitrophota bacterium]